METKYALCGRCDRELKAVTDPAGDTRWGCPECGTDDTLENVMAEVRDYQQHLLNEDAKRILGTPEPGWKGFEVSPDQFHGRVWRFKI